MGTAATAGVSALGRLAQVGLVARGVVYATIGLLALQVAGGDRSEDASAQGAIRTIGETGPGGVLLGVLAVGLAGYGVWRAVRAATGDDLRVRAGDGASAAVYGALCWLTVRMLTTGTGPDGSQEEAWTARVLAATAGRWMVATAGIAAAGVGLLWLRTAVRRDYEPPLGPAAPAVATALGAAGYAARSLAALVVAWFLVRAAVQFDPREAVGLDGALAVLASSSWGPLLLGAVALCFLAFGVFSWCQARWADLDV